ncbi:MAG: hypothetical protein D6736_20245 [Nitrospinota bacterium]|nr:MAG: hypothetical protein D6736_20245 [Nitrospinota bacterium]
MDTKGGKGEEGGREVAEQVDFKALGPNGFRTRIIQRHGQIILSSRSVLAGLVIIFFFGLIPLGIAWAGDVLILYVIGGIGAIGGILYTMYRQKLLLDLGDQHFVYQHGLWPFSSQTVTGKNKELVLEVRKIRIGRGPSSSGTGTAHVYWGIRIVSPGEKVSFDFWEAFSREQARQVLATMQTALHCSVVGADRLE